jgi:hypothetical protein
MQAAVSPRQAPSCGQQCRKRSFARRQVRPGLDALEERCLLSTFTVTSTDDSAPASNPTPGTLRWAIEQADASTTGATVNFNLTTPATITLAQGPLDLSNLGGVLEIDGPGAGSLTVSGGGQSQVFTLFFVPQGGQTVSMSGLTIADGSTTGNGGGLFSHGFMTLTSVTFVGNAAGTSGGALYNEGRMTLLDCTISANSANSHGEGLDNTGTATLINSTISGNTSGTSGISSGGGLANEKGATVSLTSCAISGNTASQVGGGVLNYGIAGLADCTISGNTAGGAYARGGGLENEGGGTAHLTDCTITGNFARAGGGLDNFFGATAYLTDCTLGSNSAAYGAGLSSVGPVTLTGCTITGNSASGTGGGLNVGPGVTNLTNCTISGNTANSGGGLINYGPANLTACTISGNTATTGGGFANVNYYGPAPAVLTDTIVAGNSDPGGAASDIGGSDPADVTGTYNLVGTGGSGGIIGGSGGNIVDVGDPGLAAPADNGGLTQTMALQSGSQAIGAGIAVSGLTTDQRGLPRPGSGAIDIGAFETQSVSNSPPIASYQAVTVNENGSLTGQVSATDADGDPLTYSMVAGPANGILAFQPDGSFTYTPNPNTSGPDSFTFQAFDGTAYSNVATVSIVVYPVNLQPPVANNDAYATPQNTSLSVPAPGVLGNDTDPLGKPLTAVLVGGGPLHGTVTLNSDGSFTYTPAQGFYGIDTFSYEAFDGQLDSKIATVFVTVGTPPVANNDTYSVIPGTQLLAGEGPTFVTMTSQPGDFVGQGKTYNYGGSSVTAKVITGGVETNTVEIDISQFGDTWTLDFAAPNQAQLVPGTYLNATRWPFQAPGVPGLDVSGEGRGANTLTGQFTVTQAVYDASGNIVSFAASFVQYADGSNASLSGQVEFNDTLGQPSGVLANDVNSIPGTTLSATLVSVPSHGTIAFNSDGSFSYTPDLGFDGIDSFTYQVFVGLFAGNVATVTIGVFQPPLAANDTYSTNENTALTVAAPGVLGNDSDPQGLPLTTVLDTPPSDGSLTFNSDGSFTYTPATNFFGTDIFKYDASNGYQSTKATVVITVVQVGQASFLQTDSKTQGTWMGTYGADGYNVIGAAVSYPGYATVTAVGTSTYVWAPHTQNTRALQIPGESARIAAAWYATSSFTLNVNLTDGNAHDLELYFLDWDSKRRAETVQLSDAVTGTVLDTEKVSSFHSGVYVDWLVSGPIVITITKTAGANAVLSGIFFDPPGTQGASGLLDHPNGQQISSLSSSTATLETAATPAPAIGTLHSEGAAAIAPPLPLENAATIRELVHDLALDQVTRGSKQFRSLLA